MVRRPLALALVLATAGCGADPSGPCASDARVRGTCALPGSPAVGANLAGGARTVLAPAALDSGSAELALEEGERAAVFLVNAAGRDGATATLSVRNVAAPLTSPLRQAVSEPARGRAPGDAGVLEASRAAAVPLATAAVAAPRLAVAAPVPSSFCVLSSPDYAASTRRPARLAVETEHAALYVDAEASDLTDAEAMLLAGIFEERIHPALSRILGAPSDVDGSGKVTLFFTNLPRLWGYYWANDVALPRDGSDGCTGTRSNGADVVYVALPSAVTAAGWNRADALSLALPGVIAHEYTHLLSYERRCRAHTCLGPEETWVEEGIAKVGEDEAGFGWNVDRGGGVDYLTRTHEDAFRGYDGRSVTRWEGDSVGNYEGAHAFFRYHADRLGPDVLAALTSGLVGTRNVERALALSFPEAVAEVATALLFSDSAAVAGADFRFTGAGWTPLRTKLRLLDTAPLGPGGATASLRTDGWNAFLTGPAAAGGGSVRVASAEDVKPWVVVVRFRGDP